MLEYRGDVHFTSNPLLGCLQTSKSVCQVIVLKVPLDLKKTELLLVLVAKLIVCLELF